MQLLDPSSGEYILQCVVQGFIACYAVALLLSLWAVSGPSPETESQEDSSSMHPGNNCYTKELRIALHYVQP